MVSDTASRPAPSPIPVASVEDDASAERWVQWQLRNNVSSRKAAQQARVAFGILFAGVGTWLGVVLFNSSLWR